MRKQNIQIIIVLLLFFLNACAGADEKRSAHYQRGVDYYESMQYQDAVLEFRNAVHIDPEFFEAHLMLGKTYYQLKDWQRAHNSLKKATDLNPGLIDGHVYLGRIFHMAGNLEKAKERALMVMEEDNDNFDASIILANVYLKGNNQRLGLDILEALMDSYPEREEAYILAARIYALQNEYGQALEILGKAVRYNPQSIAIEMVKAEVYQAMDEPGLAGNIYKDMLANDPDNEDIRFILVRHYRGNGQLQEAIMELEWMLGQNPGDKRIYLALADIYSDMNEDDMAISTLQKGCSLIEEDFDLVFALAASFQSSGRYSEAETVLEDLIISDPEHLKVLDARKMLARIYFEQQQYAQSREQLELLLKRNPLDTEALFFRGRILAGSGDTAGAIQDFRKVLNEEKNNVQAYYYLALCHFQGNEPFTALENLRTALNIEPGFVPARLELARYYARRSEYSRAHQELDRILGNYEQHQEALMLRGEVLAREGDWQRAQDIFYMVSGLSPQWSMPYLFSAEIYLQMDRKKQSATVLERARNNDVRSVQVDFMLGLVYQELGYDDKAEKLYREILEQDPEFMPAANNLAYLYAASDDPDMLRQAMSLAREAAKDNNPLALDTLGWVYYRMGDNELALQHLFMALDGDPENMDIIYHLAHVLTESGEFAQAKDFIHEKMEELGRESVDHRVVELYDSLDL